MILAHLTTAFGPAAVPSQDGFRLITGIGSGAALAALAIATFIPGRKENPAEVAEVAAVVSAAR